MDTNHDMDKHGHILEQSTNYRGFDPKDKNFFTAKVKKGGLDEVLFSTPGYNCLGDPYMDRKGLQLRGGSAATRKMHGKEFRPGGRVRSKFNSDFLNTPNMTPMISANRTHGPRGFFTNPGKAGHGPDALLQRQNFGHMIDEYDRKRDLDREERRMRRTQDLAGPFKNKVRGKRTFGNDYDEYGEDRLNLGEKKPPKPFNGLNHPVPFKYSNESRWIGKTINKHPDYMEEKYEEDPADREKRRKSFLPWKPTYKRKTEPSDSIVANFMNKPKYAFM